jgi:L-ascorbate metabolism protein UlaG (beta-lactamase superfamily)
MKQRYLLTILSTILFLTNINNAMARKSFETDTVMTSQGPAELYFLGHGTLMIIFSGRVIHIDPWSSMADYSGLPPADLILITHQHGDHLDPATVAKIRKEGTEIFCNALSAAQLSGARVMKNGDAAISGDIRIEAVPAYNIKHERSPGSPFHPKGEGNGYVLTLGDKRIYIAGDTEDIPEMANLKDIDVAFLPMNLPYTMSPEMVARAVGLFHPPVIYPYHYGDTDASVLLQLVDTATTEVRIRDLK